MGRGVFSLSLSVCMGCAGVGVKVCECLCHMNVGSHGGVIYDGAGL